MALHRADGVPADGPGCPLDDSDHAAYCRAYGRRISSERQSSSRVLPELIFTAALTLAFLSSASPRSAAFLRLATTLSTAPLSCGTQWEAQVVGEEDRHLLQFDLVEFAVEQRGVELDLGQVLASYRGHRCQRHDPLVPHRQTGARPDAAEEVVDGEVEVRVAFDVRHLPAVDLVHLRQALAAQFVHGQLLSWVIVGVCGTPSPAARFCRATSASGSSTPIFSPRPSARLRSFSPSPRVWVNASRSQWSAPSGSHVRRGP